jgi:hypothetical protein
MIGRLMLRALIVLPLILLPLTACLDTVSAQVPARVATPYTLIDDESRLTFQVGAETPLRGNCCAVAEAPSTPCAHADMP